MKKDNILATAGLIVIESQTVESLRPPPSATGTV